MIRDFETWARECAVITDKATGANIPFVLNAPQRKVLAVMERQRLAGKPIRLILLKARQWGGSTLVQMYMAWMQLEVHRGRNAVICAHVKDAAGAIRGMYTRLLRNYPAAEGADKLDLKPFEGSQSVSQIAARQSLLAIASANSPNGLRGYNFHLAHLSEVAFWGEGDRKKASEIVRTVAGTVPLLPDTMVVLESTADGKENYFYDEWQRAVRGESDKEPVFVAWHEIELYRCPVSAGERKKLLGELDDYERHLMDDLGVSLEAVAWYHGKRREYPTREAMMAEFPSTPEEAFRVSGHNPFSRVPKPLTANGYGRDGLHLTSASFAVLVPGASGEVHHAVVFGMGDNGLEVVAEHSTEGGVTSLLRDVKRRTSEVVIVERGDPSAPSVAPWMASVAQELGLNTVYDSEEEPVTTLTAAAVQTLTEESMETLQRGAFSEQEGQGVELWGSFSPQQWWRHPRLLARMVAVRHAQRRPKAVSVRDLMG